MDSNPRPTGGAPPLAARRAGLRWLGAGMLAGFGLDHAAARPASAASGVSIEPANRRADGTSGGAPATAIDGEPAATVATGVRRRPLVFPRDHGAHPETRTEWWYVTGSLQADDMGGDQAGLFGFQVTFFRSRTGLGDGSPSRFAPRQLLFAHAALSDLPAGRLRHDQRIARAGFGVAEAAEDDTRLVLRDWRLARDIANARDAGGTGQPPSPDIYRARIASDAANFALDLRLTGTRPPLLQGDAGYSRKGPREDEASHYYSLPQLAVEGQLLRDGRRHAVRGLAWLDHEWSDTLMSPEAVGWDWIGMNLDDGGALTAFRLRRRDGTTSWAGGSLRRAGSDTVLAFGPDAVRFEPGRRWTSAATGTAYPVSWQVDTPAGRFKVEALLDAQELDSRASTGAVYWEGLATLADAATGRRIGRGYLEMTGYAGALRL